MPVPRVEFPSGLEESLKRKMKVYAIHYIQRAARNAAKYAKENHPYQDRTHKLTKSIQSVPTADGAYLSARMRYGGFVEFGTVKNKPYPYLRPAIDYMMKLIKNHRNIGDALWRHTRLERALGA
jgi:phage gpG-like protein